MGMMQVADHPMQSGSFPTLWLLGQLVPASWPLLD